MVVLAHVGTRPGLVTARCRGAGLSPLTGLGHERGAGGEGRVAGIVWRFVLSPRIAATLGPGRVLPLRLLAAPARYSSLRCVTLAGCSSFCRGHGTSGMRLRAL